MINQELKYQLTALIDGELTDESKITDLKNLIEADPNLHEEYQVLNFTRSLVRRNCKIRPTPEKLKLKIINKIKPVENPLPQPIKFLQDIFSKPVFAISTAAAIILIGVILIVNQNSKNEILDLVSEQVGPENMFIQASSNFNSILTGKLTPQIVTDNAENIKEFFTANGVKYSIQIPECKKWKILGGVVSDADGEKFAHHVYSNKEGKLIYLFQVDETCLNKGEKIKLSKKMIEYLDQGKCFISTKGNFTTLMTKMDNNVCAIVSNASKTELENLFCSL